MMEVFAGFLSHTDHHLGRLARLPARPGRTGQHHRHGDLGQRRERRGRPHRHHQRGPVLQQRPGTAGGEPPGHRRDRRPRSLQPLPLGLDVRGQHALPSLEARDLPRRRLRPLHRLLARRHPGQRRGAHPVRPHHRHGAHRARPAPPHAPGHHPGRHPVAPPGRELRPHLRRRRALPPSTTPSTSRCWATAPSTTTAGGRSALGRGPRSPKPAWASGSPSRPRSSRSSTRRGGSSTTSTRTSPRAATWRPSTGTSSSP